MNKFPDGGEDAGPRGHTLRTPEAQKPVLNDFSILLSVMVELFDALVSQLKTGIIPPTTCSYLVQEYYG